MKLDSDAEFVSMSRCSMLAYLTLENRREKRERGKGREEEGEDGRGERGECRGDAKKRRTKESGGGSGRTVGKRGSAGGGMTA